MSKITFDDLEFPLALPSGGAIYQWCCKCGSRHIWTFEVMRGRSVKDDEIFITCHRDIKAEKLRRFYEKNKKEK